MPSRRNFTLFHVSPRIAWLVIILGLVPSLAVLAMCIRALRTGDGDPTLTFGSVKLEMLDISLLAAGVGILASCELVLLVVASRPLAARLAVFFLVMALISTVGTVNAVLSASGLVRPKVIVWTWVDASRSVVLACHAAVLAWLHFAILKFRLVDD